MPFVRVRSKGSGDPKHEFDVSTAELAAHPEKYTVIDREPVAEPRPVKYVKAARPRARKSGGTTKKGRA